MKTFEEIRQIIGRHRKKLEDDYKVKQIGIFGSFVTGKQKKKSDIDILVAFKGTVDFFEFLDLEEYLETLLGSRIDLVAKKALKPYIGKSILEEVVYL